MASAQRWKRQEREIADSLGGVRLPNSGRGQPDVNAGDLAVHVKTRATLPVWLVAALDQAARDAAAVGSEAVPVVVLSTVGAGRTARGWRCSTSTPSRRGLRRGSERRPRRG